MTTPASKRREYRGRDRVIRTVVTPQLSVTENLSWNSGHEPGDPMVIVPATDFSRDQQRLVRAAELIEHVLSDADRIDETRYRTTLSSRFMKRMEAWLAEGKETDDGGL